MWLVTYDQSYLLIMVPFFLNSKTKRGRGASGKLFSPTVYRTAFSGGFIYSSLIEYAFWIQEKIFVKGGGGCASEGGGSYPRVSALFIDVWVKHSRTFVLSSFERQSFVLAKPPLINSNTSVRFVFDGGRVAFLYKSTHSKNKGFSKRGGVIEGSHRKKELIKIFSVSKKPSVNEF